MFLAEQSKDAYFKGSANTIGFPGSHFNKDSEGILWRTSKIDDARWLVVPESL